MKLHKVPDRYVVRGAERPHRLAGKLVTQQHTGKRATVLASAGHPDLGLVSVVIHGSAEIEMWHEDDCLLPVDPAVQLELDLGL